MTTIDDTLENADMSSVQKSDQENEDSNKHLLENKCNFGLSLDNIAHVLITGYYNGYNVEIRSLEEMSMLYQLGYFGKGSTSRSQPNFCTNENLIMRKRQFLKRTFWYKKFQDRTDTRETQTFFEDIDKLMENIIADRNKDIIDLVSSDESDTSDTNNMDRDFHNVGDHELVVVVPNSDSEGEDYFQSFKPKCCASRVRTAEKLILSLQEAYFLTYVLECLQIIDIEDKVLSPKQCWEIFNEVDNLFLTKYVVYHYYRSKGYCVKPGIKFGGDYLLYKEGPGLSHAEFLVLIQYDINKYKEDWVSLLSHVRMAATTVKEIILVEVIKESEANKKIDDLSAYSVCEVLLKRKLPIDKKDN